MEIISIDKVSTLSLSEVNDLIEKYSNELKRRRAELEKELRQPSDILEEVYAANIRNITRTLRGQINANEEFQLVYNLRSARAKLRNLIRALNADNTSIEGAKRIYARRVEAGRIALLERGIDITKFSNEQLYKFWAVFHILEDQYNYSSDEATYKESLIVDSQWNTMTPEEIAEFIDEEFY